MERSWDRPLSIAMLALGGQGGGVLTKWLVELAEHAGFTAQSTFVAGVAQRTGATVYCVEMMPGDASHANRRAPVFTPYPVPGDVDMVIAGEITEAGRALQKGFITPNVTTLIASTHRSYSIEEKIALGNGIVDQQPVIAATRKAANQAYYFDMESVAATAGAVISAVMFGAIAASGALPFSREAFAATIERSGRAVAANLRGFDAGFAAATSPPEQAESESLARADGPIGEGLLARVGDELPSDVQFNAAHGVLRALDYQDADYANEYLLRLQSVIKTDSAEQRYALSAEVARLLALQMCYEDTIRVAAIKTSQARFGQVFEQLNVEAGQPAYVTEYFHPRIEEFCDTLPAAAGRAVANSERIRGLLAPLFRKGRNVTTNKLSGFLLLSCIGRLKRWRRGTLRYATQIKMIDDWLDTVMTLAQEDYPSALAMARCIEIVRGYGDTWERGYSRYRSMLDCAAQVPLQRRAEALRQLLEAAQADEAGAAFAEEIDKLEAA